MARSPDLHGYLYALLHGKFAGFFVPRVRVPGNTDAGIVGEDAFDALGHRLGSVSNRYLAGVKRVAYADATAIVN
jgi:hypothetical protein